MADSDDSLPVGASRAKGFIKNVNTIEDFNNVNKTAMIEDIGRQVCLFLTWGQFFVN